MRVRDLNPIMGVSFRDGKSHNASSWSADDKDMGTHYVRVIWHYGSVMGEFHSYNQGFDWVFMPGSNGWSSVSDQKGMNQIMSMGSAWYFSRKDGIGRYVNIHNEAEFLVFE